MEKHCIRIDKIKLLNFRKDISLQNYEKNFNFLYYNAIATLFI